MFLTFKRLFVICLERILLRLYNNLDVERHDIEVHLVKEQASGHRARMEAHGALTVVTQPDVRVRRLFAVIPRHFQASARRVQLDVSDCDCRQVTGGSSPTANNLSNS